MRPTSFVVALLLALLLPCARAEARHFRFAGPHPLAARFGGGFCYLDVPHMHIDGPDRTALYADSDDGLVFTGDPTPFGYDGPRFTYYGHHPLVDAPGVVCYLDGPHFHALPPPEDDGLYRTRSGVAFYMGRFPPSYERERAHRARIVAAEYRPFVSFRPTVEVEPPPEWRGEVWVPGPPGVDVRVGLPGVEVPVPSVTVEAPLPPAGVVVEGPRFAVGAPGVLVAPPLPMPPTVTVSPGWRGEWGEGRGAWHHDNGRHGDEGGGWHRDNGRHGGWGNHGGWR